ncbi:MAG: Ig-like domain-containing protein [candidate division WOR-3 bacterium]|nr:MAG: Ig-like domain-containing protein [candidate division WOR-3 bacterium]
MKRLPILLLSILLFSRIAYSYDWAIATVDETGDVGQHSSLDLDSYGNPHICYFDKTNNYLRYTYFDGIMWHYDTVDMAGDVGEYCSIVLDSDNFPHISYYDKSNEALKYAHFNGATWVIEYADPGPKVGTYTSIALNTAGIPYISYFDSDNDVLRMAFKLGDNWSVTIVDDQARVGEYSDIALGTDNLPRISYYSDNLKQLKFATFNGTTWDREIPDQTEDVGKHTSLVLDNANNPSISYQDFGNKWLKVAKKTGTSWTINVVDNVGDVGEYSSIAFDNSGTPVISYYDIGNRDLKCAYYTSPTWEKDIIDYLGDVGKFTSCAIRSDYVIFISYYDVPHKDLKLARSVADTFGPITSSANATPNPTEPVAFITVTAYVSDIGEGDHIINAAEFFIDTPGQSGNGTSMSPVDTFWDEIDEDVTALFDNAAFYWSTGDTHSVFIHGMDILENWGAFDTVKIVVTQDDDTLGPTFFNFSPSEWPDTSSFYIECQITDPSGVYDDETGSEGQGIYLLWDNDGEIVIDADEMTMFHTTGSYYRTDSLIPHQNAGTNVVYEIYAYDNDFETQHPGDRAQGMSGVQSITILDVRGPIASDVVASPNPTAGAVALIVAGSVSDSLRGNSNIYGAEYFVDDPGPDSTGIVMQAADGFFDESTEDVVDTLDISSWQYGTTKWLFMHGLDAWGNWGDFDSVLVYVTFAVDTIPPYIVSTSPDSGETEVALNRNIYITFSEPMDTASLDTSKFHVSGSINPRYTIERAYDSLTYTVGLNPDSLFAIQETITVEVSETVTDKAGNGMEESYSFFFVTGTTKDTIGPVVVAKSVYPDTTAGAHYCNVQATISDSTTGMSVVRGAEVFIDAVGPNGTGQPMRVSDSLWNEVIEDVAQRVDISQLSLGAHQFYLHGYDDANNWGDFDSISIEVTPDDDTIGPTFANFYPDSVPDTIGFFISCSVTDPSGVYDDSTGSEGQGVYLLWDNDGELMVTSFEMQMSLFSGDTFRTDHMIPQQNKGANLVYEVYAYDNDFDFNEPEDRTLGHSGVQSIVVYDARGPKTSYIQVSPPNPPEGIHEVVVYATVSDSLRGLSIITEAEAFLDSTGVTGTGFTMAALDGIYDEIREDVFDTILVSGWQAGESHTFYVHGKDEYGNWGEFDSTLVYVYGGLDTIPPWIAFTSPDSGETGVVLNTWIFVTFTERLDPTTMTSDKVLIEGSIGGVYDFWMSYNNIDSTLSINPYNDFAPFESVDVYIAAGIQDLAGNAMPCNYWWWFQTGEATDTISPIVDAIALDPDTIWQTSFTVLTAIISDNVEVVHGEYFIDLIAANGTGYSVLPVDSFGSPSVDVFDTLYTDTLSLGTHMAYLHGLDASGNWGAYDSVAFFIGGEDTLGPVFDITFEPSPAYIGDSVKITAIPNEVLHPDSSVVCSLVVSDSTLYMFILSPDSIGFVNTLSTAGFVSGACEVTVSGYDVWSNHGFSSETFDLNPEGEFLPEEKVYVWPNPARGDIIHFHFYVNANANVTVDVFNLEGKRVTRLEGRGEGGKQAHQESSNALVWDISTVASDVYIFRLSAVSDATGEKKSVIKKFAIVK